MIKLQLHITQSKLKGAAYYHEVGVSTPIVRDKELLTSLS